MVGKRTITDKYMWKPGMKVEIVTSPVFGERLGIGRVAHMTERYVYVRDLRSLVTLPTRFGRSKGGAALWIDKGWRRYFIRALVEQDGIIEEVE